MDSRTQRVVLETARHRITGDLTLAREGYRSRISDFLNQGDLAFVALSDANVVPLDPAASSEPVELGFVAIGTRHVELAYPAERCGRITSAASGSRRRAGSSSR